jgi:uncharacterized Zn finger protein
MPDYAVCHECFLPLYECGTCHDCEFHNRIHRLKKQVAELEAEKNNSVKIVHCPECGMVPVSIFLQDSGYVYLCVRHGEYEESRGDVCK